MKKPDFNIGIPSAGRRRVLVGALTAIATAGLSACGGGSDEPMANLRIVNASQDVDVLDVYMDGFLRTSAIPARLGHSSYRRVFADKTTVEVARTGGAVFLGRFFFSLPPNSLGSGVVMGSSASGLTFRSLVEDEPVGEATASRVRLLNAVPGTTSYGLFLTGDADSLVPGNQTLETDRFNELTSFQSVTPWSNRVRVIRDDDPSALVFDFTGLTLQGGRSATFILAPVPGTSRLSLGLFVQSQQGHLLVNQAP